MKLYVGVRTELDCRVMVTSSTKEFAEYPLRPQRGGCPGALEWGSGRVGTATGLALAILCDHLAGGVRDLGLCVRFEEALIATLPVNFWVLSEREVADAIDRLGGGDEAPPGRDR
jgi:hypothetical protein